MHGPQSKKIFYITTLLAILLVAGAAGDFALVKTSESATHQSPTWSLYRNELYGIEFGHPIDWSVIWENKDVAVYDQIKRFGGDKVDVVALDGKSGGTIRIVYLGTNLNFGDCPKGPEAISQEECEKVREQYKLSMDQFMELGNFPNAKKTLVNGYKAYEIAIEGANMFSIMIENKDGEVFQINFADRSTKNDLSPAELQIISTLKFIK